MKYEILDEAGNVVNVIVADHEFLEARYPGRYRPAEDTPQPEPQPDLRPVVVVTGIAADGAMVEPDFSAVTCADGAEVAVEVEIRHPLDGSVLPLTQSFRMPFTARDGRERLLLAQFVGGMATIRAAINESGHWSITEASINQDLPPEYHMRFAGLTIYVVQT